MSCCPVSIMGLLLTLLIMMVGLPVSARTFDEDFEQTYGDQRLQLLDGGTHFTLAQDQSSGSGFKSKNEYLFGRFDMDMKLAPGNSAGTVTTFYLSSPQGDEHDEIDTEFLGNSTGNPYTLHTNVFSKGKGMKEQQFQLWFDPTAEFHNYTIIWNPTRIIWLVDNSPIRIFKNFESDLGVPYPHSKPMRVYCSFWNADDWATQGGKVRADWSTGTKTVSYKNHIINACQGLEQDCASSNAGDGKSWQNYDLGDAGHDRLRWVQDKFRISSYCLDKSRFPEGLPRECMHSEFEDTADAPGASPENPPTTANPATPPTAANPATPATPKPKTPATPKPKTPATPKPATPATPLKPKPSHPDTPVTAADLTGNKY
ncbi:xyloglucan endotransglucosylase protein 7-like [Argentina anserina]|uniref:xyloglucan endotransglucosylase protein 7-like n=1 Tax=Argentina anserina TaxID=57926 RepID=UPI0021766B73|nr:xyloglucan endotransglucosylase protein 7-like [Potentilla anserina]